MKKLAAIFLMMIIIPWGINSVSAAEVNTDAIRIRYTDKVNQYSSTQLNIQIRFNMSEIQVTLSKNDSDTKTVFSATYDNWYTDDWVTVKLDSQDLSEAGHYQGQVIAYPRNRSYVVQSLFFDLLVEFVYDAPAVYLFLVSIFVIAMLPFLYDFHRKKLEKYTWNKIYLVDYFRWWKWKVTFVALTPLRLIFIGVDYIRQRKWKIILGALALIFIGELVYIAYLLQLLELISI